MCRFEHLALTRPLVVLDAETTGRDPAADRLVELAAVKFVPGAAGPETFHVRLDPGVPIPPEATAVHGITDAEVAGCPAFADVAADLVLFLRGTDLAGFNVKGFDLPLLVVELRRCGQELDLRGVCMLDSLQVFRDREPPPMSAMTTRPFLFTPTRRSLRRIRRRRPPRRGRPALRFTPYAWAKLLSLRDAGPTEVGGFGVTADGDPLLVEDLRLVRQSCTAVSVRFDDGAVADLFDEMVDAGLAAERFARVRVHTHPGDCPRPSGTDERTFAAAFGGCDWAVMFVLAKTGASYARLRFNAGPGGELVLPVEVDFDLVEPTNVTTQGYLAADVGRPKVVATADAVRAIDSAIEVGAVEDRYRSTFEAGVAIFCCVDSISTRAAVWKGAGRGARFWCDARMLGETVRVLAVADGVGRDRYPATLFPQAEAQAGRCTARGVIYTSAIAAGLMTHQFARWLRGLAVEADVTLNLLAGELAATG